MIILAIDPSMSNVGMVIYNYDKNRIELSQTLKYKDSGKRIFRKGLISKGVIDDNNEKEYLGGMWSNDRLSNMLEVINNEAKDKKVELVLCESQFGDKMSDSNTIPKIVAGNLTVPYKEWKPKSWKKLLTGNGNCEETDVQEEVKKLVGIYFKHLSEHEIDAFGLIISFLKLNGKEIKEILP